MQPLWMKDLRNDRVDSAKAVYAKDAQIAGYMVYSISTDTWYTPEEFMNSTEQVSMFRGNDRGKQFLIKDPEAGLREMKTQRRDLDQRIEEMELKIRGYKGVRQQT
jgi:hypothetical protein